MKAHRIALLPGDGIGPEVVAAAVRVLREGAPALVYEELAVGAGEYLRAGDPLPAQVFERLRECDVVLPKPSVVVAPCGEADDDGRAYAS